MATYVSMLRGINVGGNKRMKMEKLRESFEALGFNRVQTFIQSGNVVFQAAKGSATSLSKKIEKRLLQDFGFSAPVVTRSAEEMCTAVENNPFLKERGIDTEKFHVMFLSERPAAEALQKIEAFTIAPERSRCLGMEIYLYLPNGVAESKLMKAPLDRTLAVLATTRNWKTVNALHRLCQDCG